jgi:hypothetical protein
MRCPLGSRKSLVVLTIALGIGAGAPVWAVTPKPTPSVSAGRAIPVRATTLVKVTGAYHVDFPKGPSAVVLTYDTKIAIADQAALSAQADELMKFFRGDVEADGVTVAVLRASRESQGYGFVYERQPNGAWKQKAP